MARVVALGCSDCFGRFGGTEGLRKHRVRRGDVTRCRSREQLLAEGWRVDRDGVWHRPVSPTAKGYAQVRPTDDAEPSLFDEYPRTLYNGSPPSEPVNTSEEAAASMKIVANTIRGRVFAIIRDRGEEGATDDELEQALGMRHQTVSARRRELYLLGSIRSVGERPTRSGRRAKVWVAVS